MHIPVTTKICRLFNVKPPPSPPDKAVSASVSGWPPESTEFLRRLLARESRYRFFVKEREKEYVHVVSIPFTF